MNFEEMQKAWQQQDSNNPITVKADLLLKEVRRNDRQFRMTIFWRDAREVGVAFLLVIYFYYMGEKKDDWTMFLISVSCVWVGTFILVDRFYQRKKRPLFNNSLLNCIESSLVHLEHQIWLLKNVSWWYLLPIFSSIMVSTFYSASHPKNGDTESVTGLIFSILFNISVFWGVYWLNQRAVKKELEPRRQELASLLAHLKEESTF